jgi:hypothetical protein
MGIPFGGGAGIEFGGGTIPIGGSGGLTATFLDTVSILGVTYTVIVSRRAGAMAQAMIARHGTDEGRIPYEVEFASRPTVVDRAGIKILWVAHEGVAIAPPILMVSNGEAQPPAEVGGNWVAYAISIS